MASFVSYIAIFVKRIIKLQLTNHGISLRLEPSAMVCGHHCFVILNRGKTTTSTVWRVCITRKWKLSLCLTNWFLNRPSPCRRPSDPWFDHVCCDAKHHVHRLERASSHASKSATADPTTVNVTATAAAAATWNAECWTYHGPLRQKRKSFWQAKMSLSGHRRVVCGSSSTHTRDADVYHCQPQSMPTICIFVSMSRLPVFALPPPT